VSVTHTWHFALPQERDDIKLTVAGVALLGLQIIEHAMDRPRIKPEAFSARQRLVACVGVRCLFDGGPPQALDGLVDQDVVDLLAALHLKSGRDLEDLTETKVNALLNEARWHYENASEIIGDLLDMLPEADDPDESEGPFIIRKSGIYYRMPHKNGEEQEPQWVCSPLSVVALTRDHLSEAWGRLLEIHDAEGTVHTWAMPARLLAGGSELFEELLSLGLTMDNSPAGRQRLNKYLTTNRPGTFARCVQRVGWHGQGTDKHFVLPDGVYGPKTAEKIVLQGDHAGHAFRVSGTLDEWKDQVGRLCVGNSRLALSVSTALAAPLLELTGSEGGGLHLFGPSSTGKSTALKVAGSGWGGGGLHGYLLPWRATANGLEGVAARHCDCLLALDELGQADPQAASEAAYLLSNGQGKARASKDGSTKRPQEWRTLFLSTGEVTLETRLKEDRFASGHRAGQGVRVLDLPACPEGGHGIFENLHGFKDGDALARHLGEATAKHYGMVIRAFLEALTAKPVKAEVFVREAIRRFCEAHTPPHADGQVSRAAARFGLVAAAGELGIRMGVLPWPSGEALRAAATCFKAWLDQRGTSGPQEIDKGVRQVCRWFQANHASRFMPFGHNPYDEGQDDDRCEDQGRDKDKPRVHMIRDVAGFSKLVNVDEPEFYVWPEVFKQEIAKGFDPVSLAKALIERGMISRPNGETKPTTQVRVPGLPKRPRLYVFTSLILAGIDGEEEPVSLVSPLSPTPGDTETEG